MADALVGSTGFVGSDLLRQHDFRDCYHSRNIEEIAGRSYDLIVCCGMPAAKWIANREPEADRANMLRLLENLRRARAERFVLISTIDVYPDPAGVDEDSPIDTSGHHAYGTHRFQLEQALREHFESLLILRLPALFGDGLKKNAVYDLLHDNQVEKVHRDAVFQWYDVGDLWADAERCLGLGLPLVNVATEPASMAEVARSAFGLEFDNRSETPPTRYDFRTKHDAALGGAGGYLQDRATVLEKLAAYVRRERRRGASR
jgi:nucleoside-diphosphate-sugar epimerase